jgi:membrane protein required for colicin V production
LIINSHSYQALFSTVEDIVDVYIPESLILKIKEIGEGMVDQEKPEGDKKGE